MKLNYAQKSSLISIILIWPLIIAFTYFCISVWHLDLLSGMSGFLRFIIIALFSLFMSALSTLTIALFYPLAKNQNIIMTELEQNGYSERFFALSEQEIQRIISKGRVFKDYRFFSQYVRFQADGYLFHNNVNAAVDCISRTNLADMEAHLKKIDTNAFLGYFDVQMAISEELKDTARANAVLQDATPYIQKRYGKDIYGDVMINEIYFLYYLTLGDLDNALDYAQRCANRCNPPIPFCTFIGNALYAKAYTQSGQFDKAEERISIAESASKTTLHKQITAQLRNKLNAARTASGI